MEKNKFNPTLFIDTISTKITSNNSVTFYDSRNKENTCKWSSLKETSVIEKKINGLLSLINKQLTLNVYVELENSYLEGILKDKKDNMVIIENNHINKEILIDNIKDIILLETN